MNNSPVNVVCMKWGTLYGSDYVNRLYAMVQRHLQRPFRFYCITDDTNGIRPEVHTREMPDFPQPPGAQGPWKKLLMFKKPLFDIEGKTMFLDLDVVIVGPLDRFFDVSDKFCVRHEFEKRKEQEPYGNTSIYVFQAGAHPEIYDYYISDPADVYRQYFTAEQEYVTRTLFAAGKLEFLPGDWILSFKVHCLPAWPMRWWRTPRLPEGASILAFHGRPLPQDVIKGEWPLDDKPFWKAIYKHTRPCPWLEEFWRE